MKRIFANLNAIVLILMCAAVYLGYTHHPDHMLVGLAANVGGMFSHSLAMALFMGVARLVREHVGRYDLSLSFIARLNAIFHPMLATVLAGAMLFVAVGLLGAILSIGLVPVWLHGAAGCLCLAAHIYASVAIYGHQTRLHALVGEVSLLIPTTSQPGVPAEGHAKQGFRPDVLDFEAQETQGRATLAAAVSLPVILAYMEIALGWLSLGWLWIAVFVVAAALLALGVSILRQAREDRASTAATVASVPTQAPSI